MVSDPVAVLVPELVVAEPVPVASPLLVPELVALPELVPPPELVLPVEEDPVGSVPRKPLLLSSPPQRQSASEPMPASIDQYRMLIFFMRLSTWLFQRIAHAHAWQTRCAISGDRRSGSREPTRRALIPATEGCMKAISSFCSIRSRHAGDDAR